MQGFGSGVRALEISISHGAGPDDNCHTCKLSSQEMDAYTHRSAHQVYSGPSVFSIESFHSGLKWIEWGGGRGGRTSPTALKKSS